MDVFEVTWEDMEMKLDAITLASGIRYLVITERFHTTQITDTMII
jgi:hypothetical protein